MTSTSDWHVHRNTPTLPLPMETTFYTEFARTPLRPVPDREGWVTFEVTHDIAEGTGRFKGATGSFDGVYGLFNLVTGEDLGGYDGTISY